MSTVVEISEIEQEVSEFLIQPEILKKIISACYQKELSETLYFKTEKVKFKYTKIEYIYNTTITRNQLPKDPKFADPVILNNIKTNVQFVGSTYICKKIGDCECDNLHYNPTFEDHTAIECKCCEYELKNESVSYHQILYLRYFVGLTEKNIDTETLKNLISCFPVSEDKKFLVHNSNLSEEQNKYLHQNQIVSVRLGEVYYEWSKNKHSAMKLEF